MRAPRREDGLPLSHSYVQTVFKVPPAVPLSTTLHTSNRRLFSPSFLYFFIAHCNLSRATTNSGKRKTCPVFTRDRRRCYSIFFKLDDVLPVNTWAIHKLKPRFNLKNSQKIIYRLGDWSPREDVIYSNKIRLFEILNSRISRRSYAWVRKLTLGVTEWPALSLNLLHTNFAIRGFRALGWTRLWNCCGATSSSSSYLGFTSFASSSPVCTSSS